MTWSVSSSDDGDQGVASASEADEDVVVAAACQIVGPIDLAQPRRRGRPPGLYGTAEMRAKMRAEIGGGPGPVCLLPASRRQVVESVIVRWIHHRLKSSSFSKHNDSLYILFHGRIIDMCLF